MNAHFRKKTKLVAAALLVAAAPAGLSACAGGSAPRTDKASPLAPRIQTLVDANRRYPRWADFPDAPNDLPAPGQIAASVQALNGQAQALGGEVARIEWTLADAEAMAAEVRAQTEAAPVSPDSARTGAEIDAFARSLRERAKAPPPIDRRSIP
jgi:hypothetical protein